MLTLAKWLPWGQSLTQLIKRNLSIPIHIDSPNDSHLILLIRNEPVFSHVIFQVFVVDEVVAPVINLAKNSL